MIRKLSFAPALLSCLAFYLPAAEPADPAKTEQQAAPNATPQKEESGQWWEKNAMKLKPLPNRWQFHAEGTLSLMSSSGNISGSTFDLTALGVLRNGRITGHSFAQVSRRNITAADQGTIDYVERTVRQQVDYEPTESITFFAAIEDHQNTLIFMDRRLLVYGGLGGRVFRNDHTQLVLNGGLGHANFTFDRAQLLLVNPSQAGIIDTSPNSGGVVGTGTWRWNVSPRFKLTTDGSYLKYFDSDLAYRWTINLIGDVPINKRFSLNLTYRLKKETNTVMRVLGVLPLDRTFLVGIRVSI